MVSLRMDRICGSRSLAVEGCGVAFTYGSKKDPLILNGVDISVEKGTIYGLLGPSGCGKTTLLRCIVGRLTPSNGSIKVFGRYPGGKKCCIPGKGVGYMPQELALAPDMTIAEILTYFGRLYLMDYKQIKERISFLLDFLDIPKPKSYIRNLSGGQKRRVSFAAALIHQPPLLILDEPTVGVDPLLRHSMWTHLKDMAVTSRIAIIITTHYVEEARQAHTVGLMRSGQILAEMNPEELIRRHGAQTLEDVFLKLCRKESNIVYNATLDTNHIMSLAEDIITDSGKKEKVWITRKEAGYHEESVDFVKSNGADEPLVNGAGLLHDDNDLDMDSSYNVSSGFDSIRNFFIRMSTLLAKCFICFMRNKMMFIFQIFLPALQTMVFYNWLGHPPFDLPIGIVNDEAGKYGFSNLFINSLNNYTFRKEIHPNLSSALDSVKSGEAWGAMYIGPRFSVAITDRLLEGNNVENSTIEDSVIKFHMDTSNQQIAITMVYSILQAFQSFSKEMLVATYQNPRLSDLPIMIEKPVYGDLKPNFSEFVLPGLTLGLSYGTSLILIALCVIMEKNGGLLDRSWVAGAGTLEVIFSITFTIFTTVIVQTCPIIILYSFVLDIPSRGSLGLIYVCIVIAGACGLSNGLLISAVCSQEYIAMVFAMSSFVTLIVISGILWPVEGLGYMWRYVSYASPLTLMIDSMRSVTLRGWTLTEHNVWVGFTIPAAWITIFIVLSILIFKLKKV